MADSSDQEKTELPSPKRLQDAREKGQVPRSREFATFISVTLTFGALIAFMGWLMPQARFLIADGMHFGAAEARDIGHMTEHLKRLVAAGAMLVAPLLAAAIVGALLTPLGTNAYVFTIDKIEPKPSNLNPMNWVKRVFSAEGASELFKGLLKAGLLGLVGYLAYMGQLDAIANSMSLGLEAALEVSATVTAKVIGWCILVLALIAGADVPLQLWMYANRLKMSRQELKEEAKETEGNPEIKGRIRQAQREMARRRMIDDVKKADVVVTNPTHYAVALSYRENAMGAPKIVAKGVDDIAAHIREAAKAANVPIVESPKLARAIYASTELGREIPESLYLAVAYVLNYAFALKAFENAGGPKRPTLANFSVPDDLDPETNKNIAPTN